MLDQFARQAEWKIEAAHPLERLRQPRSEAGQGIDLLEPGEHDTAIRARSQRRYDRFAAGRAAAKIAAQEQLLRQGARPARRWPRWPSGLRAARARRHRKRHTDRARAFPNTSAGSHD